MTAAAAPGPGSGPPGAGPPAAASPDGGPRRVAIVPHTHWDREWYAPFQTFRFELVRLVDDLLDQMERDSAYRSFLLDGQLAVVDDYLEIRPQAEGRLRELAAAGRISLGPWYILMDEFLVSGETIVRNLQAGIRRATAFGGPMEVGYLPDMFGHVAQMPQILRQAGFSHAVVWRGVPSAVDRTAFVWQSPDGSAVRAEYLVAGYGNGAALPDDAKSLLRRLRSLVDEFGPFLGDGEPMLVMNGTDHQHPQPWLGRVVAEVNQMQSELELEITSLAEYLAGASSDAAADVVRRAALGVAGQPAHGRGLQPGRRQGGRSPGRAGARAAGRTPLGAVPAGGRLAGRLPRARLEARPAQRRPRLGVRLLRRRGHRRRAPPLRRGPADR